jgi:metal-responsive CopG/Arc/MetJ family transcriptional regulator
VKVKVSYTIDEELAEEFAKITDRNHINRSALVEGMIKRWTKRKSVKVQKKRGG